MAGRNTTKTVHSLCLITGERRGGAYSIGWGRRGAYLKFLADERGAYSRGGEVALIRGFTAPLPSCSPFPIFFEGRLGIEFWD